MKPTRFKDEDYRPRTYFVTFNAAAGRSLFHVRRNADLFLTVLQHYRSQGKYFLHEFTIMPDHVHLLLTPRKITLERTIQFIRGGYSHRISKELDFRGEVWQLGFADHRIRDTQDYEIHR